jgi:hypothetical protein
MTRQHRPVGLQPRRVTKQSAVPKAAFLQVQQAGELLTGILGHSSRALASDVVSRICASVIATAFRRRARAASCDTSTPTTSSRTNVVTSGELRTVNRS